MSRDSWTQFIEGNRDSIEAAGRAVGALALFAVRAEYEAHHAWSSAALATREPDHGPRVAELLAARRRWLRRADAAHAGEWLELPGDDVAAELRPYRHVRELAAAAGRIRAV